MPGGTRFLGGVVRFEWFRISGWQLELGVRALVILHWDRFKFIHIKIGTVKNENAVEIS